ncbi:hypothetical protein GCK32_014311 [Trichostrongylus colubriformis]|uniref:K Homology domain-containing protein n=1 Tax=Trichostrongylus colubriformis TaxID=6319 RepID=A0AAN8F358_TRICO
MAIGKVKVHPTLHKHVIGRGGALISKSSDKTGVQIPIPNEQTNSVEIVVDGKKEEQRLQRLIIGTKGENIGNICEAHLNVVLSFSVVNKKSDVINTRGDKPKVDKKIREETQTRIDLPEGDSGGERITVTGKKANEAIDQLNKIQSELANIETVEVDIPVKVQARLLDNDSRLVSDIEEECSGAHIKFPADAPVVVPFLHAFFATRVNSY